MFKKPWRRVNRVFIHCSAASRTNIDAKEINRWHKQRGWSGIGYHFFIKSDGTLEVGRNINRTPAAQGGNNRGTIAICLNGGGGNPPKDDFNRRQFDTLKQLCKQIDRAYGGGITFHGHCEVSSKACPVFDYKKVLNLSFAGRLGI